MRTMEEGNFNRNDLFKKAMNNDWTYVVEAYKKNRLVRRAKLTRTEHTILHLAVLRKDDDVVEQLVNAIEKDEASEILKLQNNLGDTPLHVAAALGLAKICVLFAKKWSELVVSACNNVGENPLYVAVHHGKMDAFFALLDFVHSLRDLDLSFCRRGDGNTILHAAVHGAYFEIAVVIIHYFPSLVDFNNEMGQSPLHLLANKPLIFKSGSPSPSIFKKLIYSRIKVDRLQSKYRQRYFSYDNRWMTKSEIDMEMARVTICLDERYGEPRPSENYYTKTVFNILKIVIKVLMVIVSIGFIALIFLWMKIVVLMVLLSLGFTVISSFKMGFVLLMDYLKIGTPIIETLKREKTMHVHANQIMKELIDLSSYWEYDESGKIPYTPYEKGEIMQIDRQQKDEGKEAGKPIRDEESSTSRSKTLEGEIMQIERQQKEEKKEPSKPLRASIIKSDTPLLVAAKRGIVEMVKNILDTFPIAIEDLDFNHKNIILLSVEHRQLDIYKYLLEKRSMWDSAFAVVDKDGNSALHLAADTISNNSPSIIAGPALQMHWEIKWYKFVRNSMESSFFQGYNNKGQTAKEIFSEAHQSLIKEGREWLRNISQSCSVIATLIATVAFTFSITVPGGVDQTSGLPIFAGTPGFSVFAQSAAVALFLSIISVLIFLNILTTHCKEWDFESYVPGMLSIGLITLFTSIISMLISFIASYTLLIEEDKCLPIFVCSCILVIFIMLKLHVYKDMARAVPSHVSKLSM